MTGVSSPQAKPNAWSGFSRTRWFVTVQGVLIGLAGMVHGGYEISRGDVSTGGNLLAAIGAFTLIPNYLLTGITAVLVGLVLILWTIRFIDRKSGSLIFVLLCILLFLVGGGFAQVAFFPLSWAAATQLQRPGSWWKKILPARACERFAGLWISFIAGGYLFFGVGFAIWLFILPPGSIYQGRPIEFILWGCLAVGWVLQLAAALAGFVQESER